MKSSGATQKTQSSGQKTQSAGISNRPPAKEEQEQRQLPPRGQAKKDTAKRQPSRSSKGNR